jgi:GNAT superfamily N-acetyltransferase
LSKYWEYDEDDFLSHENCPIWINLNNIEITEKYRGKGYGQEILKHIINLLGLNSDYTVSNFYTTDDIVFSVFPYPISEEIDCPVEDFDLKLKMVQNFYKKIGFKDFKDRGAYIYNKK